MSILQQKISREEWLENVKARSKSSNSSDAYEKGIKLWDKYLESVRLSDEEVLRDFRKNNQESDTYLFLNRYVGWLNRRGIARASISLYFAALRSWCAANGVMLFNEYIKRFVTMPKQIKEMKVSLNYDIISELVHRAPSSKMRGVLLVLLSSGMRISEILQLRPMDINSKVSPIEIKVRASTTKTREERLAYMSKEAWNEVRTLVEDLDPKRFIFLNEYNIQKLISFEIRFGELRKKCGFLEKYENGRNYHVNIHAFRAFFHTQATKVLGGDTAHALIGHHQYLDQYFRLSKEERGELYKKLEPYVTVSEEYRQKTIIDEKESEIKELKSMKKEMELLLAWKARVETKP